MDEREQRWLEKRFRLPENPQILCHPLQHNSSLDKFTCEVRSLSVLLDYRPEDTKKHCFEVALFAELFNEMLIRDFGFNIYKVLYAMPEPTESTTVEQHDAKNRRDKSVDDEPKEKRHRTDSKSLKRDETTSKSDGVEKEKDSKSSTAAGSSSSAGKDSKSRDKDRDRDRDREKDKEHRRERTSRREEDNSDDERSMDGKKRETKKMITVDPDLLLSFVYFDQTYCGYIFSNHLEELFYALGLRLSRADAKKIINKVAPRSLFYRYITDVQCIRFSLTFTDNFFRFNCRKLTDKPKDEASTTIPSESVENLEELGKGNTLILPSFVSNDASGPSNKVVAEQAPFAIEVLSTDESLGDNSTEQTADSRGHMVMYNGALINVEKLLQQLNRSEKAREETEWRLSELLSSNSKSKEKMKDLQSELKSCSRKMNDAESNLSSANVSAETEDDFCCCYWKSQNGE